MCARSEATQAMFAAHCGTRILLQHGLQAKTLSGGRRSLTHLVILIRRKPD